MGDERLGALSTRASLEGLRHGGTQHEYQLSERWHGVARKADQDSAEGGEWQLL